MTNQKNYTAGKYESSKHTHLREPYYIGLQKIIDLNYTKEDLIHHFPAFAGHQTIIRFLSLYELYKMTNGVAGHIAEMGVYKASGTLLFAKLLQIFEPNSLTQVHGFDWFKGNVPTPEEPNVHIGSYNEPLERVERLVDSQGLSHVIKLHDLDLTKDLPNFLSSVPHLRFKLVFADAGIYDVVREIILNIWPRISKGGILILDQYNFDLAPGETRAVNELLPDAEIRTFPWGWMPTAYIVK
jgi:hypothetical protein